MIALDDIDRSIIEELQVDGRLPFAKLAPRVGLSQAATRQRVNRLIGAGAMQVVAVTDPSILGFDFEAMVMVTVDGDVTVVADSVAELEEIVYVVITAGRFDILIEVVCRDADHLLTLLNERIRPIPGVRTTEILSYLRLAKQSYSWGAR
jgi:Lrp/AsnC family transcriptional regulator for asnA, asnC and gidA